MQNNNSPTQIEVPEVVVQRLPIYVRGLSQLLESKKQVISSHQLGELLQMTPAQIRKDLAISVDSENRAEDIIFSSYWMNSDKYWELTEHGRPVLSVLVD